MSSVSNLPHTAASATATNTNSALIKEMKRAGEALAAQIQQLTALVTTDRTNTVPAPATGGGIARVHYNPAGTRRVRYPPLPSPRA